ncbi:MAG: gliding motility-associated C-terminal domain-containing protein [Bacteroidales bacterium]
MTQASFFLLKRHFYILAGLMVIFLSQKISQAQLPFEQSFTTSTAPGFTFGGNPNPAILTAPGIDPEGQGVLRITNNSGNQTGFVYSDGIALPSAGLNIEFEYFTYGGSGADGIVFFLFDALADPFQIGGFGGSLGYAQRTGGIPGVSLAYLGIGLDEFGNFSNPTEGRQGGPGSRPQSVTLRGSGNGSATTPDNYPYLTHVQVSQAPFNFNIDVPGPTRTTDPSDSRYRKVEITLKPRTPEGFFIDMAIITGGTPTTTHQILQDFEYATAAPDAFRLGFSAGTGGLNNFHEIRNLVVTAFDTGGITPPLAEDINRGTCTDTPVQISNIDENITVYGPSDNFVNLNSIDLDPVSPGQQTTVTIPGEGTFSYNSVLQVITFTPESGFDGVSTVQYTVLDAFGIESNIANISVAVSETFCLDCFVNAGFNSIFGLVYEDLNANGELSAGEPGIENIEVELYEDTNSNGVLDLGEPLAESNLTNADGEFQITISPAVSTENVRDEFSGNNASGNNGSTNWIGPWVTSGNVAFTNNEMRIRANPSQATRSVDLTGASAAVLSFDYLGVGPGANNPSVDVLVADNPAGPFTVLFSITTETPLSFSQDISIYISGNTTIRFRQLAGNNNTGVNIDNVDITFNIPGSANYILQLGSPLPGSLIQTSLPLFYPISFTGTDETSCDHLFGLIVPDPFINIEKDLTDINGDPSITEYSAVGDIITYSIVVENTGNVTITNIDVTDPLTGLTTTIASLAPGASQTYNESYTITQADLDAGSVTNTASAAGEDTNGDPVSDNDSATVNAVQDAQITVTKTANPLTYNAVGDVIDYTIIVENTGNVTVTNITVTDPLTGLSTTIASLAPGASQTFNESYTITQADLDNGSVTNTASAAGEDTNGDPVSDNDSATVTAVQDAEITVTKTANPLTYDAVGDIIDYTIVVENTGNVTITNITVEDPLTGLSTTIASLAPGASQTFSESYTITQADLDNGSVTNTVSAEGEDTNGDPVSDSGSATVTAIQNPELTVTKTADPTTYNAVGDVITYTITVENTGNVTVSDIDIVDDLTGDTWFIVSLDPGVVETFTATYVITQADLDNGSVTNTVTAEGEDTNGDPVTDSGSATVTAVQNPELTITKTADSETYSNEDEVIEYTLIVTNTGNVTLTDITVDDPLTGFNEFIAILTPAETISFTTTYIVTYGDLIAGSITNTATASTNYNGSDVISSDNEIVLYDLTDPEINITIVTSDVLCFGEATGTAEAIISGGLQPYSITWYTDPVQTGPIAFDIPAGTYVVMVSDTLGNTAEQMFTINQPLEPLNIIEYITHVSCHGEQNGFIEIEVFGGTQPYTYLWSNGETSQNIYNMAAGLYSLLTEDVNGCTLETEFEINEPDPLVITNIEITGTICITDETGVITFDINGGVPPYSYLWSNGSTEPHLINVVSGDYSVEITDSNGCTLNYDFYIPYETDECDITTSQGFSPNGDGFNDFWIIDGITAYPQNTVQVFNRWGTLVYEATPYENDWDAVPNRGRIFDSSGKLPAGTYYYLITLEPGGEIITGWIYIAR